MSVAAAIDRASALLPGTAATDNTQDPRWQAIIDVAEFIPSNPAEVWSFAARWGAFPDADLQAAVATCVLEHLLEHHFEWVFPQAAALARRHKTFARTLRMCWRTGQAELPDHARAFEQLIQELRDVV